MGLIVASLPRHKVVSRASKGPAGPAYPSLSRLPHLPYLFLGLIALLYRIRPSSIKRLEHPVKTVHILRTISTTPHQPCSSRQPTSTSNNLQYLTLRALGKVPYPYWRSCNLSPARSLGVLIAHPHPLFHDTSGPQQLPNSLPAAAVTVAVVASTDSERERGHTSLCFRSPLTPLAPCVTRPISDLMVAIHSGDCSAPRSQASS